MEQLLVALQTGDEDKVNELACELLITSSGQINRAQVSEFEAYAPCKVVCLERDSFGWLVGGIKYGNKTYSFG